MSTTINYDGTPITYSTVGDQTTIGYGANSATELTYQDGNVTMESEQKLCVNRGWLLFGDSTSDLNHAIYNDSKDIDGEGVFDGMKINCFEGLRIRTGVATGQTPTPVFEITQTAVSTPLPLTAQRFQGQFKVGDVTGDPSADLAGTLKYVEHTNGSELFCCMLGQDGVYEWKSVAEN